MNTLAIILGIVGSIITIVIVLWKGAMQLLKFIQSKFKRRNRAGMIFFNGQPKFDEPKNSHPFINLQEELKNSATLADIRETLHESAALTDLHNTFSTQNHSHTNAPAKSTDESL